MPELKRIAILEITGDPTKRVSVDAHNASHKNYLRLAKAMERDYRPILVPVLEYGAAQTVELMRHVDGVILGGGEDVNPAFYNGATSYRRQGQSFPDADEIQRDAASLAIDRGLPILGICRGMQLLNVMAGGTLIQDLGEENKHVNPRMYEEKHMSRVQITLEDSDLQRAFGRRKATVHCNHHQALDEIPPRFRVVARSGEVVESIEDDFNRLYGVQWHPEDRRMPLKHLRQVLSLLN